MQKMEKVLDLVVKNARTKSEKRMASDMVYTGSAWDRESKNGTNYISVSLDLSKLLDALGYEFMPDVKVNLAMFENTKKKSEKSPDWSVVYFKDKEGT